MLIVLILFVGTHKKTVQSNPDFFNKKRLNVKPKICFIY